MPHEAAAGAIIPRRNHQVAAIAPSRRHPASPPNTEVTHASSSVVRRLHESLFLYELPDPTAPSPLECHVRAVLSRFHRTGGPSGSPGESAPDATPHAEALTLLGAALKYNGLSYEQGYRSCCSAECSDNTGSPTAFLSHAISVRDFISFAIDMLDAYLPSETCAAAMQLVVANYFDPSTSGVITFECWSLSLLKVDDTALQLARDLKSRSSNSSEDPPPSHVNHTTLIHLLPLPSFPARRVSTSPVYSHPLPKVLSAESETQMLLELVSGERAALAFEATTSADNGFLMAAEATPSVGGSSRTSYHPAPASPAITSQSGAHHVAADATHLARYAPPLLQAADRQRSPSPAGDAPHFQLCG